MKSHLYDNNTIVSTGSERGCSLYWFVFLLTCIFPPMFLPIDIRLLIGGFWLLMGDKTIGKHASSLVAWLAILSIYSIMVFTVNQLMGANVSVGVPLRFIRSLFMLIAINSCLSTHKANDEKKVILNMLELLMTIHAIIIIFEIIVPETRDLLYVFAGKARIFYQYRAGGFVNSFDFAGFYCIVGAVISSFMFFISNNRIHIVSMIICIAASVFTSRLNMFVCLAILVYVNYKTRNIPNGKLLKFIIKILTILIGLIVVLMWAITTDAFTNIRTYLFDHYTWISDFYSTIRYTYSDDSVSETIATQFSVDGDSIVKIFGTAMDPNRDPGYVQMLYGIGIIGTLISLFPSIVMITSCEKIKKMNINFSYYELMRGLLVLIILYQIIMNAKILFLYSTGAFELSIIVFILAQMFKRDLINNTRGMKYE